MAGIGDCILVGPESMVYNSPTVVGNFSVPGPNNSNNVPAAVPVAGTTGIPQGIYPLGTQYITKDGRKFRYASAGAVTLVRGNTLQASISLSTDQNMSATASTTVNPFTGSSANNPGIASNAVGRPDLAFTHGSATVIANFFAEGFIQVEITPGGGDGYKIIAHPAFASGANTPADLVNLWPGQQIRRALTDTTSKVSLLSHPYSRIIQTPATLATGVIVGVCTTPLTGATGRGNFGWVQTAGACGVLTDNTSIVVGQPAITSTVTAGAISLVTTTNIIVSTIIGQIMRVGASAGWSTVWLKIDS